MSFGWIRITLLAGCLLALAPARADRTADAAMNSRIDALLARMTPEEKAAQLSILGSDYPDLERMVRAGLGGTSGVLPGQDVAAYTLRMQRLAMQSRLKIPLLFMGDVAHGFRTVFPMPLALAATWDPALVTRIHRAAAAEATAAGVTWTFSPMIDISRDPRWGRIVESGGEDPYLGAAMALAQMRGFQGDDLAAADTMLATAKHFAGYGAVQAGRDYNATAIPPRLFRDVYLAPFKAVADAGIGSFMAAFTTLDGVPATSSRALLTETLHEDWGYRGLVVSDFDAVKELQTHGVAASPADAARLALHAGVDVDLHGGTYLATLPGLLRSGEVPQNEVDAAVRRVLEAKYRLGLFDDPFRYNHAPPSARGVPPVHRELAREAARRSMVLLKNAGAVLPLARGAHIAVIGPLADDREDLLGPMHALGEPADVVTVLAALRTAMDGHGQVSYARGVDVRGADRTGIAEAVRVASAADVTVLVLGESEDMIGEGNSRARLDLPGQQQALAEAIVATGKPVVAVIVSGRPLDLSWLDAHAAAIVDAWLPGDEGGPALADLLFGAADFAGRLPVTFPRELGQVPISYDSLPTGRPYDPQDHYTTHYVDLPNTPLYPFGYGLSYTAFRYGTPRLDHAELAAGGTLHVSATVTNTGRRTGTAVAQLYVHGRIASVSRPLRELKGFARITLAPGETREVHFTLQPADLAFSRRDMSFGTEAGEYDLYVGADATADASAHFTLTAAGPVR